MLAPNNTSESLQHTSLLGRYLNIRQMTEKLCESLETEDYCIQSMPDASPARWHLAHTTWFFETFVLGAENPFTTDRSKYRYLSNSYYNTVGEQFPRAQRGLLSRPTVAEVFGYRREIDDLMIRLLEKDDHVNQQQLRLVEVGLQHEQQHQELLLTDIKHALSLNPLNPRIQQTDVHDSASQSVALMDRWKFDGGIYTVGALGDDNIFCFDNEGPQHRVMLEPFSLSSSLVTNAEFMAFICDGGYRKSNLWLSSGWAWVTEQQLTHPLYWRPESDGWFEFTLAGLQPLRDRAPVCHLSYFEADAFARWMGMRLPTEFEWEVACQAFQEVPASSFADQLLAENSAIHPWNAEAGSPFGQLWQWTNSSYGPYPGYRPHPGAIGEYNGKFMCNQYVLRGGSVATSSDHIRATYRNFFPTEARWQFTGIRLAHLS